eukprot:1667059-Lingulodinium_polyedra.AAC.1
METDLSAWAPAVPPRAAATSRGGPRSCFANRHGLERPHSAQTCKPRGHLAPSTAALQAPNLQLNQTG